MEGSDQPEFSAFLDLLGNTYSDKLNSIKSSENEALERFRKSYGELFSKSVGLKSETFSISKSEPSSQLFPVKKHFTDESLKHTKQINPDKEFEKQYLKCIKQVKQTSNDFCFKNITVPEPFNLTCYQESVSKHSHINCVNTELPYKLPRTKPVPAQVHLPVYQLMIEIDSKERGQRLERRRNKLLAEIKPFNLSGNRLNRSQSLSDIGTSSKNGVSKQRTVSFSASPFPKHLFTPESTGVKELNNQLRKIRIKARAEEMLKQSSLPFSGKSILKRWNSFSMDKPVKMNEKLESKLYIPASVRAHSHYSLVKNSNSAKNEIPPKKYNDKRINESIMVGHKTTKTAFLRHEIMMERLAKETEMPPEVTKKETSCIYNEIKKGVLIKVKMNDHLLSKENIKEKLRQNRKSDIVRAEEYAQELKEMNDRIRKIPLLIDRQSMDSARKSAERKIKTEAFNLKSQNFQQKIAEKSERSCSTKSHNSSNDETDVSQKDF